MDLNQTQQFKFGASREDYIRGIISEVYSALEEKGYNPVSQIVGYILSEDPTYITTHKNARSMLSRVDRYDLLQSLVQNYITK